MAYVAPIHRPTSVRHAIRIQFSKGGESSLVLAKSNRIEVWQVEADATTLLHSKAIYGSISLLQRVRPKDSDVDLLFVGTERLEYFTMSWDDARQQLLTVQALPDHSEPHMREAESQSRCVVDPSGRFMALHVWEGVINISRLIGRGESKHLIQFLEQVRLTELFMKSSTFLYSHTGPRIAFLYQTRDDEEDSKLAIYRLTADDRHATAAKFEPKERQLDLVVKDRFARMLIPVPIVEDNTKRHHVRHASTRRAHLGGVLVVGETSVLYVDSEDYTTVESPFSEGNIFVAWEAYDVTRYFLADDFGRLYLLTIVTEGVVVTGIEVSRLGSVVTSRASTLVHMGNGILFIGSHYGDSQLLQVDVEQRTLDFLGVSPAFSSNAPILDFVVMDMGDTSKAGKSGNTFSSGETRLVAGCGALESGSLRGIRSGVGLEDLGILDEFENVRGLFTLKSHGADKVDILLISSVTDTRAFKFDEVGGIEEVTSFQGMKLNCQTLLASNLPDGNLLQITSESATILDAENGIVLSSWSPPKASQEDCLRRTGLITEASANDNWALLSVDGTMLVSLNLRANLKAVSKALSPNTATTKADQISCVHASPALLNVGVVGFWRSVSVTLCDLETLEPLHGEDIPQTEDSASVPRDVVLVQLHPPARSGPTLLVAMDDGNVVTFNVSKEDRSLSGRKSVTLGTRQARLHILPEAGGLSKVFATTEQSSLIHSVDGRIAYSATTAQDAVYVAPFDSEAFPESIVIADSTSLKISQLDSETRTQVNAFPFGKTVRRLAYSPTLKAFVLLCINRTLSAGEEILSTEICLVDESTFEVIGEPHQLDDPTGLEIPECILRATWTDPEDADNFMERFIVGTSITPDPAKGAADSQGRILVFGVDRDRKFQLAESRPLRSVCHCLALIDTSPARPRFQIVAGHSESVVVYDYDEPSHMQGQLRKVAQHRSSTCPQDLSVHGNLIGVADIMKSLTILQFTPRTEDGSPSRLIERARHHQEAWTTALCHVDGDSWLQADAMGQLMVLRENTGAATKQDRQRLELTSCMNFGEQVNRIRPLDVPADPNAIIRPQAFLGTVLGGVYLFGAISSKYIDLLMKFQSRLAEFVETPGNTRFMSWRTPRLRGITGEGPVRFVDGAFLELFLDMSETMQDTVCDGLGPKVEDMRNLVEELRRLH
ncbi:related to UV-damaged DNA-binding protein [Cephalotrichum gorgonifer]|uniref:Related to UV-damaged DNA-binding protein n=1 Tax=Cephalotrichum gorgonifer TaxID=2041049 RepID=A0AAE8MU56_9PEZI|nr:related to UV-damaged DNA-binding protein [Cephalotrichum gorgonifer]